MEEWLVYVIIAAVVVLASSWFLRPTKGTDAAPPISFFRKIESENRDFSIFRSSH
jgi:hypothetical protein